MIQAAVLRRVRHRHATRKAGHWNAENAVTATRNGRTTRRSGKTTFLKSFLGVMIPFTAGHGIFVAFFVFHVFPAEIGPGARVSLDALSRGMIGITPFLLASLLFDLVGMLPDRDPKPKIPRGVRSLGRWLPEKQGRSVGDLYREAIEAERSRTEDNERTMPATEVSLRGERGAATEGR